MSIAESYRRKIESISRDLSGLFSDRAREQGRIGDLHKKIADANQAKVRAFSSSAAQSKQREIDRHEADLLSTNRKLADIDTKIARRQKERADYEEKLAREEHRESQRREREAVEQRREHEHRMSNVVSSVAHHETLRVQMEKRLLRLEQLPDTVTVVFFASNPLDQNELRLDEEVRAIKEMIRKSKHRDSIELKSEWAVRPRDVLQALNEYDPTIVHFSGHGSRKDQILFQDAQGNSRPVSLEAIVQTMVASSGRIRLVFFNTCYSEEQARSVVEHVEAAIGMSDSIGDDAARVFASQFYSSLGFGHSAKRAFDQAKALLMLEGVGEEDVPKLFTKAGLDPDTVILVRPADPDVTAPSWMPPLTTR